MADTDPTPDPTPETPLVAGEAPPVPGPQGMVLHRFDSGLVCCEMPYEHGKLQGEGKMYYTTGGLYARETYAGGVLNGPTTLYYPDGVLQAELHYVDGLLEGTIKEYFSTGRVESVSEYRKGKKNGVTVVYNETGAVESKLQYLDDSITVPSAALLPAVTPAHAPASGVSLFPVDESPFRAPLRGDSLIIRRS